MIDASALLAYLLDEPGADKVEAALDAGGARLSTVNRAEVKGKLVGGGHALPAEVDARLGALAHAMSVEAFDLEQSELAAEWYAKRNPYDLSLGDCACIALAEARGEDLLTAERAWAKLPGLRVKARLIR